MYRFAPALLVRFLGALLVGGALLVLLAAGVVALLDAPPSVLTVVVVVVLLVVALAAVVAARARRLVTLDETGYRVALLRGAGVRQARWRDVEEAVSARVRGHDCVVIRLRDGRTTTIPVLVLDVAPETFLAELTRHLDRGHGYRRLR